MKKDPIHKQIMKTKDAFVNDDNFDPGQALEPAVDIASSAGNSNGKKPDQNRSKIAKFQAKLDILVCMKG